jgi:uncharacterized protein (DUF4415 family)
MAGKMLPTPRAAPANKQFEPTVIRRHMRAASGPFHPEQLLSLRLPPEVIAGWKATGPGWQTRMADVLKKSTPKTRRHVG